MDAEPAINMVLGRGAVSFTHPQAAPGAPIGLTTPLYTAALAGWLLVWGISETAVMSMNCLLVAAASFFLWMSVVRSGCIRRPWLRVALAVGVPLLPAVTLVYRLNRYDSFGMLGLALACAALTLRMRWQRLTSLVVAGLMAGTAGLHVAVASAVLGSLALIFLGRRYVAEFVTFGVAAAAGLAIMLGILFHQNLLDSLRTVLSQCGVSEARAWHWYALAPLRGGQLSRLIDGDALCLLASLFAVCGVWLSKRQRLLQSGAMFGLCAGVAVPLALSIAGRYSDTYVWLAMIPMVIGCVVALDHEIDSRRLKQLVGGLLAVVALSGFPTSAFMSLAEWRARDPVPVEAFIARHIEPDDVVYTTFVGYYPVKTKAGTAFFGSAFHSMTAEQRAAVTLAVIGGKENGAGMYEPSAEEAFASFGGEWMEVGHMKVPRGEFRKSIPPRPQSDCTYNVVIYRKRDGQDPGVSPQDASGWIPPRVSEAWHFSVLER